MQNVTQCKMKSPAFLSRPHFHLADPSYAAQFQSGLRADPERHDSHFLIEPLSSIPLKVSHYQRSSIPLKVSHSQVSSIFLKVSHSLPSLSS